MKTIDTQLARSDKHVSLALKSQSLSLPQRGIVLGVMKSIVQLIRVRHWVKNTFVLVPAFFAGVAFEASLAWPLLAGFVCFSLVASSIYILNDIIDVEQDRLHPEKQLRPLASGALPIVVAYGLMALLMVIGLGVGFFVDVVFGLFLLAYFFMNVCYCFGIKQIAILDVCTIATGFVLRVLAGGAIAGVVVSNWLILMTFQLALLMAIGKRRSEFASMEGSSKTRPVLQGYNLPFLDMSLVFACATTVVSYAIYSISEDVTQRIGTDRLFLTTVFVVIGVLRYLQQVLVFNKAEAPTKLLYNDRFLQVVLAGWAITFGTTIYGSQIGLW